MGSPHEATGAGTAQLAGVMLGLHTVLAEDVAGVRHCGETPPHGWGPVEGPPGRGSLLDTEPLALCTGLPAEVDCSAGADSVVDSGLQLSWKGPWTPKAWLCLCGTSRSD